MRSASPALAAVIALAGCLPDLGPYPNIGERLDLGTNIDPATATTWIAAGPVRSAIGVLILGYAPDGRTPRFAYTQASGWKVATVRTLEGSWSEDPVAGTLALHATIEFSMADESGTEPIKRSGSQRRAVSIDRILPVIRAPGTLQIGPSTPDTTFDGSYLVLPEAMAAAVTALDPRTAGGASCAFQLANLAVVSSEARIVGFGGAGMVVDYSGRRSAFVGTLEGEVSIQLSGLPNAVVSIDYAGFVDFSGVQLDGPQDTATNMNGDGRMSGKLGFRLSPHMADGTVLPDIDGTVDYGGASPIQISYGIPSGGLYDIAISGGASTQLDPLVAPAPGIADCLGLP